MAGRVGLLETPKTCRPLGRPQIPLSASPTTEQLAGTVQPRRWAVVVAEWAVLRWLVPLAFLHGLAYLALVPPWQHYDEPTHLAYAAQIAAERLPGPGLSQAEISHAIADSMFRHGFWGPEYLPDLLANEQLTLGESQQVHPPLYYGLVAAPLVVLRYLPLDIQLYTARGVSLLLYMLTVVAAWRIAVAVAPKEPALQLLLPLLLLLTPTFADLMTSVNNDVLLNTAATISLLGAVLLVRDGPRPGGLALAFGGLLVAVLAKRTGLALLVPLGMALLWSLHRRPMHAGLVGGCVALLLLLGAWATLRPELVAGPSGEYVVLGTRSWLDALDQAYLRLELHEWVRSVSDPTRIGGRYQVLVLVGFASFWAHFSWGNVGAGPLWEWLFGGLVLGAAIGLLIGFRQQRRLLPLWQRRTLWLFGAAVVMAWVGLFTRLHPLPSLEYVAYVPRGRYMFWAMVPSLWLLALGLRWLLPLRWRAAHVPALLGLFACFDLIVWSVVLVRAFYG